MSRTFRKDPSFLTTWTEEDLAESSQRERVQQYIHRNTDALWRMSGDATLRHLSKKGYRRKANMEIARSEDPIVREEQFVRHSKNIYG